MDRQKIKRELVEGFENNRAFCFCDLDDTYRIYCYIEDKNGFWNTWIHMAIDNNVTKEINLYEVHSDMHDQAMFEKRIGELLDYYEKSLVKKTINEQKPTERDSADLLNHLIGIIEQNDKRFSFEWASGGEKVTMEIYDKEKDIGYVVKIEPIEYDENGEAVNL